MRKIFLLVSGVVIFSLLISGVFGPVLTSSVQAATVTFSADTALILPNGTNLTILSGSLIENLVVNDDNSIALTFGSDTNLTIRSNNVYTFSSIGGVKTCYAGSYSQVKYTEISGSTTLNVEPTVACTAQTGGGGGGGAAPTIPTNVSVVISSGAAKTESTNVTLTLAATNATLMLIANKSDFSDTTSWENYATSKSWVLTSGVGTKTVYAKFKSADGGVSSVVSDTIELVEPTSAVEPISGIAKAGDLIKKASSPAVYYLGADGKRYSFPSADIYQTWYSDFSGVRVISNAEFNGIPWGGNVSPRPGVKLVQFVDGETPWNILDPKIYALAGNGTLRHITSAALAAELYGSNWESKIVPVVEILFGGYTKGDAIESAADYIKQAEIDKALDINTDKGL